MGKHNCGQCEYYLHKSEKCPHRERTAYSEECEMFSYTNPTRRIDSLQERIKELETENKLLKRPLETANFNVDGMLAVGNELTKQTERIKELEKIAELAYDLHTSDPLNIKKKWGISGVQAEKLLCKMIEAQKGV